MASRSSPRSDVNAPVLRLHSSVRGILLIWFGPALLLALPLPALRSGADGWFPTAVLLVAVVALGAGMWNFPLVTEVGPDGVTRICTLRRHRIPWTAVDRIDRVPKRQPRHRPARPSGGAAGGGRRSDTGVTPAGAVGGLLLYRDGRRSSALLCDVTESVEQFDTLRSLASAGAPGSITARRPPEHRVPTGTRWPGALR